MNAPVTVPRATLERWAFVVARASGALSGAARAFEKNGHAMPEMRASETECDAMRDEMRDVLYPTFAHAGRVTQ